MSIWVIRVFFFNDVARDSLDVKIIIYPKLKIYHLWVHSTWNVYMWVYPCVFKTY